MIRHCAACEVLSDEDACWLCGGPMVARGIQTASGHTYSCNRPYVSIGGRPVFVEESTKF